MVAFAIGFRTATGDCGQAHKRDLVKIQDAYRDEAAATGTSWRVSSPVRLFVSPATAGFHAPFAAIRESTILGPEHRHAFLHRVGFDRPGFGSFSAVTPLPVSECTHGNIMVPSLDHLSFYTEALGLVVQTPVQQIEWTVVAVRHSRGLQAGKAFQVVVFQTPCVPSALLRVYAPREPRPDCRDSSRPGARRRGNRRDAATAERVWRVQFSVSLTGLLPPDDSRLALNALRGVLMPDAHAIGGVRQVREAPAGYRRRARPESGPRRRNKGKGGSHANRRHRLGTAAGVLHPAGAGLADINMPD
jgi:hypothetical protein